MSQETSGAENRHLTFPAQCDKSSLFWSQTSRFQSSRSPQPYLPLPSTPQPYNHTYNHVHPPPNRRPPSRNRPTPRPIFRRPPLHDNPKIPPRMLPPPTTSRPRSTLRDPLHRPQRTKQNSQHDLADVPPINRLTHRLCRFPRKVGYPTNPRSSAQSHATSRRIPRFRARAFRGRHAHLEYLHWSIYYRVRWDCEGEGSYGAAIVGS